MADFKKLEVTDGFMRGTEVGVSVQIGISVTLTANLSLKAKTVSNIFSELSKYKRDFRTETWKKIEQAHASAAASGDASFFYLLFSIAANVDANYDYENQETRQKVQDSKDAQRIAQALQDTDESEVTISGQINATGQSYVPTTAYIFIHLTQVTLDGKQSFNAIANQPEAKAAAKDGSQSGIKGEGKLNLIERTSFNALPVKGLLRSEVHVACE